MPHRARPRILFLTRNCPFGQSFGAQLRAYHIARHLQQCGDVEMGLLLLKEADPTALERTKAEFELVATLRMQRQLIRGLSARLRHELDPWFVNTEGWVLSSADAEQVTQLMSGADVVWFHNLAVANGARVQSCRRAVLDIDDIPSRYERSALGVRSSWMAKALTLRRVFLWKRREAVLLRRFGIVAVCSEADRVYLGGSSRIHIVPNGFELATAPPPRSPSVPPRVGFVGLLQYPPNQDGVRWFVTHVWPEIKKVETSARLRLVGSGADSNLPSLGPDIDILGWLEDPSREIASWTLTITPIRMGGGTRIKVLEAFARKCPVVSTTLGAFGHAVQSGEELLLADSPADFAKACLRILQNPEFGAGLAERAWVKYRQQWTWAAAATGVAAAVDHSLRLGRESKAPPPSRVHAEVGAPG